MPFWQRMGAIFEHFWLFFGPRVHFCNYVLYDPEQGTNPKKNAPFLDHFWIVSAFGGSPFFDVFLVPLLDGIFVNFGAKVAPQRELLGSHFGDYLATLRPYVESVIFDNTHALEPRSTLPRRLQNLTFWVLFLIPAWGVVSRTTF